jgi:hypothetical protein
MDPAVPDTADDQESDRRGKPEKRHMETVLRARP